MDHGSLSCAACAPQRFDLATEAGADKVFGASVTSGFFSTLGLRPQLGRLFPPEECLPGSSRSVVLGDVEGAASCQRGGSHEQR